MEEGKEKPQGRGLSASFVTGAIALIFMAIGYQTALFIHSAARAKIISNRDKPDTVYVVQEAVSPEVTASDAGLTVIRKNAPHSPQAQAVRQANPRKVVENFSFNPNTVTVEDLQRLGFSLKQAQSIDNYRSKGGRFRRKSDFAKSFVVADSVFERLEPFIDIPLLDLNRADSAAFDELPGIGPYFAAKMVEYRERLGGYSYKEQLMDIYNFDEGKFAGLQDLVYCGPHKEFPLWTASEDSLSLHPYISRGAAHGIVLYRRSNPRSAWTVEGLARAGILPSDLSSKLSRCLIAPAE